MTDLDVRPGAEHAVVIGAGISGLLAARVLANHFEQVTVVERDALPDGPQARTGVPQGRLLHAMLPRGLGIIERLFPGYGRELLAAGAQPLRLPADGVMLSPGGWVDRRARGCGMLAASRPLYEWIVRRRLRDLPGVRIVERHDVTSLRTSPDHTEVTGVSVRPRGATPEPEQQVAADLVVDATGRASRAPTWLAAAGYPTPPKEHVDADVAYAGRLYRIPDGFSADWRMAMLFPKPPTMARTGFLLPIEDGLWMAALMGAAGQHPPAEEDGFLAFARSLRHPIIADTIAEAESASPVRAFRGTANRLWHYERMSRWPERFVVLGDAVCAFNPIYGQGMSTGAVAAQTLDTCLCEQRRRRRAGDLDGLARRFQRRLARRNAEPWMMATGEDLRYPTTTGMRVTPAIRLRHRYLDRVVLATTWDPATADAYTLALGMIARPTKLFTPPVLAAVARSRPGAATPTSPPVHPGVPIRG